MKIVLYCYKKCLNVLWYFDGTSAVITCSQFIFKTKVMCICFCGALSARLNCELVFVFKCPVQWWPENILQKHSCFFFTLEKIQYRSNLAASSDFAVTSRRMIIYTGNQTFPIGIMSVFKTRLYIQHLRSLFWFLLTMLGIISLTTFPIRSVGSTVI